MNGVRSIRTTALVSLALLVASGDLLIAGGEPKSQYVHDPTFAVPPGFANDPDYHPIGYLSTFPVTNPHARLSERERCVLRELFVQAYAACRKKYRQDYLLATVSPIYQLLKTSFPAVAKHETEGRSAIFLGDIAMTLEKECTTPYDEKSIIDYAKSIDVQRLDPALPAQPFEDWLRTAARAEDIGWRMSEDCDIKRQGLPHPPEGLPLCVKFGFRRGDVLVGGGMLTVGTLRGGIGGSPELQHVAANRTGGGRGDVVRKLSALPAMLEELASRP